MQLDITTKTENELLSRMEVEAKLSFEKSVTPRKEQVREALAKELKAEPSLVTVRRIRTAYGSTAARVFAYVYKDASVKAKLEPKTKKQKLAEKAEKEQAAKKEEGA